MIGDSRDSPMALHEGLLCRPASGRGASPSSPSPRTHEPSGDIVKHWTNPHGTKNLLAKVHATCTNLVQELDPGIHVS